TAVPSCATTAFASNIAGWLPVGDDSLVFLDDFATDGADEATLRFIRVSNGLLPAKGTILATHVSSVYAPLGPALPGLVYTVQAKIAADWPHIYPGAPLGGP